MLQKQVKLLQDKGESLIKASADANANEAMKLMQLAMDCFSESRKIMSTLVENSVLIWLEFAVNVEVSVVNYPIYCEFCARNNLRVMEKQDFTIYIQSFKT